METFRGAAFVVDAAQCLRRGRDFFRLVFPVLFGRRCADGAEKGIPRGQDGGGKHRQSVRQSKREGRLSPGDQRVEKRERAVCRPMGLRIFNAMK